MAIIKVYDSNNSQWNEVTQLSTTGDFTGGTAGQVLVKDSTSTGGFSWSTFDNGGLLSASTSELNIMHGATPTSTEINKIHGLTVSGAVLNNLSGFTSDIQTRINNMYAYTWTKTDTTIYAYTSSYVNYSNSNPIATVDLSSVLPSNTSQYEIILYCLGTGSNTTPLIRIETDIMSPTNFTGGRNAFAGLGIFPVGTGRSVSLCPEVSGSGHHAGFCQGLISTK